VIWLAIPAVAAGAYYTLASIAALRFGAGGSRPAGRTENAAAAPISILKPVRGRDPRFYEAIRSHATQDYPEFEILFGTNDPDDPALEDIERLRREFPGRRIEAIVAPTKAPNAKAGIMAELAKHARYSVLLVNDSDIVVEPGYLRAVAAALSEPNVGLVTCLYRADAESWAARFEALGIATEFAPSVMTARLLGQGEFALGATMALSAETLAAAGGFESLEKLLADDYQLGVRVRRLGYRIEFAPGVVSTSLGMETWKEAWRHQVRWSRTIRVSRPGGFFGYAVTHATLWALVAFAAGQWEAGAAALIARMTAAAVSGRLLGDPLVPRMLWLVPFRDLFGFAVWAAGAFGSTVWWRGRKLRLSADGAITPDWR
jgi:ceramide glucosyltransferase